MVDGPPRAEGGLMQRFKNILFVTGEEAFTRTAYAKAVALAIRNQAQLTIIDVIESIPDRRRMFTTGNAVYDLENLLVTDSAEQIDDLLEHVGGAADVAPEVVVVTGSRHIEIIRRVLSAEHDLVIIADVEDGYGTTTHHLLRKAPCPVWVMTPSLEGKQRILAAVDPDPLAPTQELLNDDVLALATSLALQENAPLHIVHAWSVPRGTGFGVSASVLEAIREETATRHRDDLAALIERHPIPADTTVHFLEGSPAQVIREVMLRRHINVIVIGTVDLTGIAGLLIGNSSETILRRVDCSVLAVKPQGFETPVRLP